MTPRQRVLLAASASALAIAAAGALLLVRRVDRVLDVSAGAAAAERVRPLSFAPRPAPALAADVLGDGTVNAVAAVRGVLVSGGGSGFTDGTRSFDVRGGLPSVRIRALASWRGTPVWALERGGWGRVATELEEASSPWGRLEVRAFLETEGGELLIGARQGLFRAGYGAGTLERIDREPVRALALAPSGEIAAGGETGLRIVGGGRTRVVATPDPWIESLGADRDGRLWAATAIGIASGPWEGPLGLHPRGGDGTSGVFDGSAFWFVPRGESRVARVRADGSRAEETTPEAFRAVLLAGGALFGDGASGLYLREKDGRWTRTRERPATSLPLPRVNALAADGTAVWAGFFDGGIARADDISAPGGPVFRTVPSDAWGVNALLPAGGAVWAATLRGTFRVENGRTSETGTGAAFALASTPSGVVLGTAQGVAFPERRLLSAFHGLPGNQALALASVRGRDTLWVGTPSGLGRIDGRRVSSRVVVGEGKLPHPWVTALAARGESLFVATYGGGVASVSQDGAESWTRFPETEGLKVNALAVTPDGRVVLATVGKGLWASDAAASRFAPLDAALPSPDVMTLALAPADAPLFLLAGTSEGLARIALGELR